GSPAVQGCPGQGGGGGRSGPRRGRRGGGGGRGRGGVGPPGALRGGWGAVVGGFEPAGRREQGEPETGQGRQGGGMSLSLLGEGPIRPRWVTGGGGRGFAGVLLAGRRQLRRRRGAQTRPRPR